MAFIPFTQEQARERFEEMSVAVLEALNGEKSPDDILRRGREIGIGLVRLNLLKPAVLERSLICLAAELATSVPPEKFGLLLAGIAGGFSNATELALLSQQESVNRAATQALRDTKRQLEETNQELSEQIAERTRAEKMQRELAQRLSRLHEIDKAIGSADSLQAILETAIAHVLSMMNAMITSIMAIDPGERRIYILSSNHPAYPAGREMPISMFDALANLDAGKMVYLEDMRALGGSSAGVDELIAIGGRSMLAIPLRYRSELVGALGIVLDEVRPIDESEKAMLNELAGSLAVAIQNRRLLEAEQEARSREATLREVAAALISDMDLPEMLQRVLAQLRSVFDFHSATIMLLKGGELEVAAQSGIDSSLAELQAVLHEQPLNVWAALYSDSSFIIHDTMQHPGWVLLPGREGIRSWMGVPLQVKGRKIGILTIDRDEPDSFSREDVELAAMFANQAAVAIENAQLFAQLQAEAERLSARVRERTRDLEVLYGIAATAVDNPGMEILLDRSMSLTAEAFGCSAAATHLLDGPDSELSLAILLQSGHPQLSELLRELGPNSAVLRRPLESGRPEFWINRDLPAHWAGRDKLTLATVAIRSRGNNLGVLSLLCDTPGRLSGVASGLLTAIGDQIGAVVENIRLHQLARQAAILEERERLARNIHDQATQSIYSAGLFAEAAHDAAEAQNMDKTLEHIQSVMRMTSQSLRELRLLLFEFRTESLARLGLVEALRERLKNVENRVDISGQVHAAGIGELPVALEEAFYRIAMETLNNALRHSEADTISIILFIEEGDLVMTIVDNGIGFDSQLALNSGGMGLDNMQKRIGKVGGTLRITSHDGDGTWITARAPLGK